MKVNLKEEEIINNIKKFRKKLKLSQDDIAKMMSVKQNTISQWETGERTPSVLQGMKLAEILETTVENLYKENIPTVLL